MRLLWAFVVATCGLLRTVHAHDDDLTLPIRATSNGHFLEKPNADAFFWLADTAWMLFAHLTREEADQYLRDRADKGFTVILAAVIFGSYGYGDPLLLPNRYGERVLIQKDSAQPNIKYFEHVDWVVERARKYGLRMGLLPAWGVNVVSGYDSSRIFDLRSAREYGEWIARRYRGKGIIWVLGGDANPVFKLPSDSGLIDFRPVYDAMALGITVGDAPNPFITYHPAPMSPSGAARPRPSLYFGSRNWLDMNMLQTAHVILADGHDEGGGNVEGEIFGGFRWSAEFNYIPVGLEYRSKPTRPVLDGETRYEDHPYDSNGTLRYWRAVDSRNAAYHALMAGAAGHTYGNYNVWDFYSPERSTKVEPTSASVRRRKWQEALASPGAAQMRYAKQLLLSRPYFSRIPDQSVVVCCEGEGASYTAASRDRDGSYVMVYLPHGQRVTLDLTKVSGKSAIAWWFNPRTGTASQMENAVSTESIASFDPPTMGAEEDWILVVDDRARGFGVPGVAR
jgi:hypothetical protein